MSIVVRSNGVDKRIKEIQTLYFRAKAWSRAITCRKCGVEFSFDATDLNPSPGDYGGLDFWAPYVQCPLCGTNHLYLFRIKLFYRWVGRYFQLRYELGKEKIDWAPKDPEPTRIVES